MHGIVAVDMGGTWIRAAAVSDDDTMGPVALCPTGRDRPPEEILDDLAALISRARAGLDRCHGLALGLPTVLDRDMRLAPCDNLPTLVGTRVVDAIVQRCGLSAVVDNDANCFAVGEWWKGAGRGARTVCGVTLGTGIGVGLVLDGRLYSGSRGQAGEIWQSPYLEGRTVEQWTCGGFLSGIYAKETGEHIDAESGAERAAQGDPAARRALDQYGAALGKVLAFVVDLIDPDAVVLGGAVARSFPLFRDSLQRELDTGPGERRAARVVPSELGEVAALWGAAYLFREAGEITSLRTTP